MVRICIENPSLVDACVMDAYIGYGVSKKVDGPYEYVDTLIYSGFTKNSNPVTTTSNMGIAVLAILVV